MSVLTGLLMVGAFSARATGSALIAAVVVWDVVNRRRLLTATLPILIVFAAGVFGLRASTGVADYSTQLTSAAQQERSTTPLLVATSQRVGEYFNVLGSAVHAPHGLTKLVTVVLGTLFVTGIVSVCARRRALAQAQPLRARLLAWVAACPLEFWYLGAYMSALFVLALRPEMRTLLPVLPIFIAAIVAGAQALLSLRPNTYLRRATVAAALLLILALNVHLRDGTFSTRANHDEGDNGAFCRDCRQLYSFISAQTPAEARIAFAKPRALALLTSRKGWMWSPTAPESVTWEAMRTIHIEYVVVPREGYVLSSLYPDYLSWRTFEQRPGLAQIFANDTFRVYRIDWQP